MICITFNTIIFSLIGWLGINNLIQKYSQKDLNYNSRIYSNIHAIIIFIYSVILCSNSTIDIYNAKIMNGISAGYALFDMYRAIQRKELEYIVHHLIIFLAIIPSGLSELGLYELPYNYYYMIARAFLSESSTIFLNNSWLLLKNNLDDTKSFYISCVMVLFCFTFFRIINFTNITYILYLDQNYSFMILVLPMTILNYYWYYKLTQKYIELFKKKKD